MNTDTTIDQGRQRAEALQREAARLADQAREQLADYARSFDVPRQTRRAQAAAQHSGEQIQRAAGHASDQAAAMMAAALEDAAGRLRSVAGEGPAAHAAHTVAGALEQSSETLRPWGARSAARRLTRAIRRNPGLALLAAAGVVGAALLGSRARARSW